ncbi:MAG: type II restriction endonuclease [Thermoanaerobaculia bacterium]
MAISLASLFAAVADKTLALVDLPEVGSHQHELNGSSHLRDFFGTDETVRGEVRWHYFAEDQPPLHDTGSFTFYDSRAKSADRTGRSEWRMYYTGDFLSVASPGDLLVLARTLLGEVHALVVQTQSSWARAVGTLFGLDSGTPHFRISASDELDQKTFEFVSSRIVEELELDFEPPSAPDYESIAARELGRARNEGRDFPTTRRMGDVSRETVMTDTGDVDATLLRWLETEERIFRAMEREIVEVKLRAGFASVDEFISYSLSVQNRRKSRMGLALQNHLAELFRIHRVRFSAQAFTENRKKPDFLFPGAAEYHDPTFDSARLTMLAAKSTCKDRWPQVLTEASRIQEKHLCTIEPAISESQTDEMQRQGVILVIPEGLQRTFSAKQCKGLLSLSGFVDLVRARDA